MWPILIASRGRPAGKTFALLRGAGVPFTAVVEAPEETAYRAHGHDPVTLPAAGRGLAYARQFCLDHARARHWPWYWSLDDDVSALGLVAGGRCRPADPAFILTAAGTLLSGQSGVLQGAMEYRQYAWKAAAPLTWGSYCDVVVLINTAVTARFRPETGCKCDRDFTVRVLAGGGRTCRTAALWFEAPRPGSNRGGLHDHYAGRENVARDVAAVCRLWGPDLVRAYTPRDGLPDARIRWRALAGRR